MTAFDGDQYRFAVERLAEGDMPTDVALALNAEWKGSTFSARDVAKLQREMPDDWRAYHDACRATFAAGAPTSDVAFRIALLDKMARACAGRNAIAEARALIELIDKIQSGYFGGKGNGPTGGEPVTEITRTVVDPRETEYPDTASVPAAAETKPV